MDVLNNIYGGIIGAEVVVNIKHGNVSVLYGKISKKMLDEIQITCKIHSIKSGCIFLIKNSTRYTVKTKGDAVKVKQSIMNAVNLC
ncbi:MAG: hypothetical protein HN366_04340 [Deltaproteobacteria bacterium]|jgi:hypothetical protein|nr:hypothetical protein [Deltaproteobacteria bacterium]